MQTRRAFLLSLGVGIPAVCLWRYADASVDDAIVAVLDKRLNYLRLDPAGVRAFANDLAARDIVSQPRLRLVEMVEPVYSHVALTGDSFVARAVRHGEDRIVTLFLLSSDFFDENADEARMVRYLGFYDPLRRPCRNPFARLTPP